MLDRRKTKNSEMDKRPSQGVKQLTLKSGPYITKDMKRALQH